MEKIETEHLILRKAVPEDLDAIYHNIWQDMLKAVNLNIFYYL